MYDLNSARVRVSMSSAHLDNLILKTQENQQTIDKRIPARWHDIRGILPIELK